MPYYFENNIKIPAHYSNNLDIEAFSQMMKDPSYCYKFYWLEALVRLISQGVHETTFNDVIDEMISNAWYSVREYHIHLSGYQLGEVRDGLERAVNLLADASSLTSSASSTEIKNAIAQHNSLLKQYKEQLTNMVPYRALAGFFNHANVVVNWSSTTQMIQSIQEINEKHIPLPYTLGPSSKLKKEVYFHPQWAEMIQENTVAILGWIQHEKIKWLQNYNPEVPGLVYKLSQSDRMVRKLGHVKELWKAVLDIEPIFDLYTNEAINKQPYDIDHFIPWSFVMNDEVWNLMPMDSSLNSSKSNKLPKWDPYFRSFMENQYKLYSLVEKKDVIKDLFYKCFKDNLHSIWAGQELYRPGNSKQEFCRILEANMHPVYDSARRQGYETWNI